MKILPYTVKYDIATISVWRFPIFAKLFLFTRFIQLLAIIMQIWNILCNILFNVYRRNGCNPRLLNVH